MAVHVAWRCDTLDVRLSGMDAVWAFRRHVTAPRRAVADARVVAVAEAQDERPPLRAPGTHWPPRIVAGTYRGGTPAPQFWCVRRAPEVLVVDLRAGPFARVVVEVGDPDAAAAAIRSRIADL